MPSILPANEPPNAMSKGPSAGVAEDSGKPSFPPAIVTSNHVAEPEDNNKQKSTRHDNNNKKGCQNMHPESDKSMTPTPRKLDGYVGFANLPNQIHRNSVKKGFEFTLMVVGESGLGKSTLINSMFLAEIYSDQYPGPSLRAKKTVAVESTKVLLKENGVNLTLTIVDTPGFGVAVDNSDCWVPIIEYIDSKYEEFLNAETRVMRHQIPDSRVHCCLYFIAPTGHGLKPLDVEFMKRLHEKVNIVPIIAKADTMTPDECADFKKKILSEIAYHKINVYTFPEVEEEEDNQMLKILRSRVPFAVVGANTVVEHDGKKILGREYPWGVVEGFYTVENLEHCDFLAMRNMVIRTHLNDLKDVTNNVHYENFRIRALVDLWFDGDATKIADKNPLVQLDEEKRDHEKKMKKLDIEMEEALQIKVRERRQKLKESESDFQRLHEQRQQTLEEELGALDEKRRAFEAEKSAWEQQTGFSIEELRRNSEANSKASSSASSMGSIGGGDTLKGSRRLGNLLRRQTSVKSLHENVTQLLQPVVHHSEHV